MGDVAFEKLTLSEEPLYGPRKLLLCGFPPAAQGKFKQVLEAAGLGGVSSIWVTAEQAQTPLSDLLALPDDTGRGRASTLPRAIVVSGILKKQLGQLMGVCRQAGMKNALWATLTPTSESWTIGQLLTELAAEKGALKKRAP